MHGVMTKREKIFSEPADSACFRKGTCLRYTRDGNQERDSLVVVGRLAMKITVVYFRGLSHSGRFLARRQAGQPAIPGVHSILVWPV